MHGGTGSGARLAIEMYVGDVMVRNAQVRVECRIAGEA
jgi:hypothetical protein